MAEPLARPGLLVWDERFLGYDFGPDHPFRQSNRRLAVHLLEALLPGDRPPDRLSEVPPASRRRLETFHRPEYVDRVEALSVLGKRVPLDSGDTPSFPGCFEEAARIVEGAVRSVEFALDRRAGAFHPAGGLHHAHPDTASGFCVFNDLAVAIARALEKGLRVAYLDVDAHHGDGVMYGFYGSGRLLDIDFHQDGRTLFPGTGTVSEIGTGDGAGSKVNVPLPPGAGDELLLPLFRRIVPPLLRAFRPELLVVQHGADGHAGDPLSSLAFTSEAYDEIDERLVGLAGELCDGRLVITGGGGYRPEAVARVLARAGARICGVAVPSLSSPLPSSWRDEFEHGLGTPAPPCWGETVPSDRPGSTDLADALVAELEASLGVRFPGAGAT